MLGRLCQSSASSLFLSLQLQQFQLSHSPLTQLIRYRGKSDRGALQVALHRRLHTSPCRPLQLAICRRPTCQRLCALASQKGMVPLDHQDRESNQLQLARQLGKSFLCHQPRPLTLHCCRPFQILSAQPVRRSAGRLEVQLPRVLCRASDPLEFQRRYR